MKNRWLLGILGAIVIGLVAIIIILGPGGNGGGGPEELEIGCSRLRISLPVFVAAEEGIFEKHGLNVNLQMYDTAQPLMQALVSGRTQVAGYTALPITYNGMLRSGTDLYFLTTMVEDQDHRISYLLRPTTVEGRQIQSPADLRGKTIGILPTIAYKAWLEVILRENGLDPEADVSIIQVAPTQQPQAIKSGGVDALFTNDPAATAAIRAGVAELVSTDVECPKFIVDPFPFGSFNVSRKWANDNPGTFRKLVAALDEAVEFVNSNPERAKQDMRPYLPEQFADDVALYPNARYLSTSESKTETFQSIADSYLQIGIIDSPMDLTELVVNENE